jgi:lysophospholipase L1-like esterase
MIFNRLLSCYGFVKPYKFGRAVIVLIASVFLTLTLAWAAYLIGHGELLAQSARGHFFAYVLVLFGCAIALAPLRYLSVFLLAVGAIEVALASATHFIAHKGLAGLDLLPTNMAITVKDNRFKYHAALGIVPRENFKSANGVAVQHNSKNMRGSEILLQPSQTLINVYGGSTTYDIGVDQGQTWPEQVGQKLGASYLVANHGVPGYSTAEHVIQTAFYSDLLGRYPDCAVYYIGWNDIRNAHLPSLDAAYADFHLVSQFTNLNVRRSSNSFSPFVRLSLALLGGFRDAFVPYPPLYLTMEPLSDHDPKLEKIFSKNIKTITTINDSHNIKTVFVGQLLNREQLVSDSRYGWLPRVRDRDVWPLQERFNEILKLEANKVGATYLDIDINKFAHTDFVDNGHFSTEGSKKFAKHLVPQLQAICKK